MNKLIKSVLSTLLIIITLVLTFAIDTSAYYTPYVKIETLKTTCTTVTMNFDYTYDETDDVVVVVYRSFTGKKGTWTKIAVTKPGAMSYSDKGLKVNTTYYYIIKTYFKDQYPKGKILAESVRYQTKTIPTRPVFSSIDEYGYGVLMTWDKNKDVSGYKIYRSPTGKKGTWTCIAHVKSNKAGKFADKDVEAGDTYFYCFKAYQTYKGKNYYSSDSAVHKMREIGELSPIWKFELEETYKGILLTFNKNTKARGYLIYRSTSGKKGTWTKIATIKDVNKTSFLDTTAENGKIYFYTIKCFKTLSGVNIYSADAEKICTDLVLADDDYDNIIEFNDYGAERSVRFDIKGDTKGDEFIVEVADEKIADLTEIYWVEDDLTFDLTFIAHTPGETTVRVYYPGHPYADITLTLVVPDLGSID